MNICTMRNCCNKNLSELQFGKDRLWGITVNPSKICYIRFEKLEFVLKKSILGPCQNVLKKFKKDFVSKRTFIRDMVRSICTFLAERIIVVKELELLKNERKGTKNRTKRSLGKSRLTWKLGHRRRGLISSRCVIFVGGTVAVRSLRSVRAHKLKRKPDDSS